MCARAVDRPYGRSPAGRRTRTERSSRTLADPLSRSHVPSFRPPPPQAPRAVRRSATFGNSRSVSLSVPLPLTHSLFLSRAFTARPPLRHIAAERAWIRERHEVGKHGTLSLSRGPKRYGVWKSWSLLRRIGPCASLKSKELRVNVKLKERQFWFKNCSKIPTLMIIIKLNWTAIRAWRRSLGAYVVR